LIGICWKILVLGTSQKMAEVMSSNSVDDPGLNQSSGAEDQGIFDRGDEGILQGAVLIDADQVQSDTEEDDDVRIHVH
jgi:hypothetical protein